MQKPKSIFLLPKENFGLIYNQATVDALKALTDNDGEAYSREALLEDAERFSAVEIVFSGWGAPKLDAEILHALPRLRAFFYGAGTVRGFVTEAFWDRGVLLTSAYKANAVPVAEYAVASIVLALKEAWRYNGQLRNGIDGRDNHAIPGVYHGSKVGIISLGAIGQLVCQRLKHFDVDVLAFDPFVDASVMESCGVERVDKLETLFAECDVVSLHAPWLPETEGMITGEMLRMLPDRSTFINTSRGAIVDEKALIEVLRERPDLQAVIDVITDESSYAHSPLAQLPNVFLTPHLAGSMGRECHRMGALVLEECRRFLAGEPAVTQVTRENIVRMA